MRAIYMMNLFMFSLFLGMTLTHIVNGFWVSAIPTGLVMLLFIPGLVIGNK